VPLILDNIRNFRPRRGHVAPRTRAPSGPEQELLERLRALAGGVRKANEVKRMIDRVRTFSGYRQYPKYGIVNRYFV
jgi:rifampicin phosphotransferase